MTDTLYGWWFSPLNKKLGYGDGREVRIGRTHKIEGKPILCKRGLHASESPLDALEYASSCLLYRVKLSGKIVRGMGKACATERTYLQGKDVSNVLEAFARKCALDVIHLWEAPSIVKEYLETGKEELREAARAVAWEAARKAALERDWAAEEAARAAETAAREVRKARKTAKMAARGATWDAPAWEATWAWARKKQNNLLLEMLKKEFNI